MKTDNVNGTEYCERCGDEGWVTLTGEVAINGHAYTRGTAPCRWCLLGARRYARARESNSGHKPWTPLSDYAESDILPVGPEHPAPGPRFTPDAEFLRARVEAGCSISSLKAMFPRRIWPSEWPQTAAAPLVGAMPRVDDDVEDKRRRAQIALIGSQTQKPASQEAFSDHAAGDRDLDDAENLAADFDEIPF